MDQTRLGLAGLALAVLMLPGCGGGTPEDPETEPTPPESADPAPPPDAPPDPVLSGFVVDGPVAGAEVEVLDAAGNRVATGTSDAEGAYAISVPASATYPLTLRARGGTDVITEAPADFDLSAVVIDPAQGTAVLTPHSTLLVRRAECAALAAGASPEVARAALTGADARTLEPWGFGLTAEDLADVFDGAVDGARAAPMLLASEAFSETLRRAVAVLSGTDAETDGNGLLDALACDLGDGVVNGTGTGASARTAAAFRIASAEVLAELVQGRLRVGGADAMARIGDAVEGTFGGDRNVAGLSLGQALLDQFRRATVAAVVATGDPELLDLLRGAADLEPTAVRADADAVLADPETLDAFATAARSVTEGDTASLAPLVTAAPPSPTAPAPPRIAGNAFLADPPTLDPLTDERPTLSWTAEDALICRRSASVPGTGWDGVGGPTGAVTIEPVTETASFELTCAGPGGVASASLRVLVEPTLAVAGVVLDGPVAGAEVVLYDADGNRLFGTITDAAGRFDLTLPQTLDYFPLTIEATGGRDVLRDALPAFPALTTVLQAPADEDLVLGLHATVLARRAECDAADADARRRARNALTDGAAAALEAYAFGLDPGTLGSVLTRAPGTAAARADLLLANHALGETLRRAAQRLTALGAPTEPGALLEAVACDLDDGFLNGSNDALAPSQAIVVQTVMADVLRHTIAGAPTLDGVPAADRLDAVLAETFGAPDVDVASVPLSAAELDQLRRGALAAALLRPDPALFDFFDAVTALDPADSRTDAAAILGATPPGEALDDATAEVPRTAPELWDFVLAGTDPEAGVPGAPTVDVRMGPGFSPVLATRGGETMRLEWSSTDALRCLRTAGVGGWGGPAAPGSDGTGAAPPGDPGAPFTTDAVAAVTDFTLRCVGAGGTAADTQTVLVPPEATLELSADAGDLGEDLVATYAFRDASACTVLRNGVPIPGGTLEVDAEGAGAGTLAIEDLAVGDSLLLRCQGRSAPGAGTAAPDDSPVRRPEVRAARLTWAEPTRTVAGDPLPADRCVEQYRIYPSTAPGLRDLPPITLFEQDSNGTPEPDGICEGGFESTGGEVSAVVDLADQAGRVIFFEVTAVDDDGRESGFSNTLNKIIAP